MQDILNILDTSSHLCSDIYVCGCDTYNLPKYAVESCQYLVVSLDNLEFSSGRHLYKFGLIFSVDPPL